MDSKYLCELILHRNSDLNIVQNSMIIVSKLSFIERFKKICWQHLKSDFRTTTSLSTSPFRSRFSLLLFLFCFDFLLALLLEIVCFNLSSHCSGN